MAEERPGVASVIRAFAIVSGIVAIHDVVTRRKSMDEARARHDQTKAHLAKIETGIKSINAKLSGK